ncbi:MAG: hypothetical protein QOG20_1801 [Pseudonocardiales bacterium]|nr:hypothetical protein [Pseudonocardiales bacterium]
MSDLVPFSFHEFDLDDARAAIAANYFPTTLDLGSSRSRYEFRFEGTVDGPLTVGHAWYTSAMRIGIEEVGSVYVNFPSRGAMLVEHRHSVVDIDPTRAAVFRATGAVAMTTSDDYGSFAVKIAPRALEDALEAILGRPVPTPLELGPTVDLRAGPGRGWARLVRLLAAESRPDGLAADSIVASPLREAVLHGLLRSVDHPYRDALDAPAPSYGPRALRLVVEAVHANPAEDFTLAGMARIAHVSVRTLQEMFRRHLDTTPFQHLRQVRLARAHEELGTSDPATTTIGGVARRWGFTHTGRFAATYRAHYGVSPSTTMRRGMRR